MRIVLCPTLHEHDREVSLLERLMHGTTDGGLLVLPGGVEPRAAHADEPRLPLRRRRPAQADRRAPSRPSRPPTPPAPTRRPRHLLDLGHRRIAAITGPRGWMATEERQRGYHAALAAAGVLPDPRLVIESNFDVDGGRAAAAHRCSTGPSRRPRYSPSTTSSRSARCRPRSRATSASRSDLSIVGFDDTAEAELVTPRADHGAPAARRDGADGRQPAHAPARQPAPRGAPRRARNAADRARSTAVAG